MAIHTVLGAGQVGRKLAEELLAMGHEVRLVRRGAAGPARPGLEWFRGDITDAAFLDQACRGASVVYNCVNPPDYARWEGVLEPLFDGVLAAATRASARLVVLDCLYMIGRPETTPFDEHTPMRPCSEKGRMRARLVERLFAAHARGDLEVTSGRASDFFGPETPLSAVLSPQSMARIVAGKSAYALGDPDLPRSYSYTPDVARGLAVLGTRPEAVGRVWHLPVAAQQTTRVVLQHAFDAAGRPMKLLRVPRWIFTVASPFSPWMAAAREMLYQWEVPYAMDDRRFRETFGLEPTPLAQAVEATLRAYHDQSASPRLSPRAA